MAFPQVAAVNGGNDTTNQTNHTVNLPSGIEAGNLLLVFFASDGGPTITFPEGWTQLFQTGANTACKFGAWYRIADGTEGSTITVTTSNNQMTAHTSYRITGYSGTPEVATATTGIDYSPNPPSLTPSWGALDTLWFACCGYNSNLTVTVYPTNYTNGRYDRANNTEGCGTGSARRELNAASENPGMFTLSGSTQWVANTVAVKPVVGAEYTRTGSCAIGIATSASRVGEFARSGSCALGILTSATRAAEFTRLGSCALGILATAERSIDKIGFCAIGIATSASRSLEASRVGTAVIGVLASATRSFEGSRLGSTAIGILTSAQRTLEISRLGQTAIGILTSATRQAEFTRMGTAVVGLLTSATRSFEGSRLGSTAIGIATSASRAAEWARTGLATIGVWVTASRVGEFSRTGTAVIGIATSALILFIRAPFRILGAVRNLTPFRTLPPER